MLSDTLQAARLTVKHEDWMSDDDEVIEVTRTDFLHAGGSAAIAAADDDDSMSWHPAWGGFMRVTTLSRGAGREGSRVQYRKKAGGGGGAEEGK
jgi:hypothetical protein